MIASVSAVAKYGAAAEARVVRMAVGDDGAVDRMQRVDEESARLAEQALRQHLQPCFGMRHAKSCGAWRTH